VAVYAAVFCLSACQADKTGLFATVHWSGVTLDQLEITVNGAASGAAPIVAPTLRPVQPGPSLASPQTLAIYLPDALSGTTVTCVATGLAGGTHLDATATATTTINRSALAPVELDLMATGGPGANGQPCTDASQCDSTLCVDGVCCASACGLLCQSCNVKGKEGLCMPVPAGTPSAGCAQQVVESCGYDGTCDGSGGCRRYAPGAACAVASCQTSSTLVSVSACDGQGTCVQPPSISCAPNICDPTTLRCRTTCVTNNDCVGAICVNGSCGPKPPGAIGEGCSTGSDCASTFCKDGVCCQTDCSGSCVSCNQPTALGTCTPVPAGKIDPHSTCMDQGVTSCGTNGLCDGSGACTKYPQGALCAIGLCGGHLLKSVKQCDGNGACLAIPDIECAPFKCDVTTTACFTSCTANNQCAAGHSCQAGVCM
jgi:hypothetical protein